MTFKLSDSNIACCSFCGEKKRILANSKTNISSDDTTDIQETYCPTCSNPMRIVTVARSK